MATSAGRRVTAACLVALIAFSLGAMSCSSDRTDQVTATAASQAPAVKLKDLRGNEFDLSTTRCKVVLINFWATWCGPCKAEIPDLASLYTEYRGQGLEVLGFTVDSGTAGQVTPYVHSFGINYPVFLADSVRDQFYTEPGIPMTIVLNRKGQVVGKLFGMRSRAEFEEAVLPLLKEPC
ncbi:MAG: TlpA disulfide reductase family protein [Acidobacteriota bacterium]